MRLFNDDVTEAFEKVAIGPERKSKIMSDTGKSADGLPRVRPRPGRPRAARQRPDSQSHDYPARRHWRCDLVYTTSRQELPQRLSSLKTFWPAALGGRVAEELIYGPDRVTTGAGNDLQQAAELARDMVMHQGMGSKLRDQVFQVDEGMMLERLVHEREYSDETAKVIDDEVEHLITEAANRARVVIKANRVKLKSSKTVCWKKTCRCRRS